MDPGKAGRGQGGQGAGEGEGAREGEGEETDPEGGTGEEAGVDSGVVVGEEMGAGAVAGGKGGPAISAPSCKGHKERRSLEEVMSVLRTPKRAKTKLVSVKIPGLTKPVKKSITQLIELFKETKEWRLILQGDLGHSCLRLPQTSGENQEEKWPEQAEDSY